MNFDADFFRTGPFMPHGHCYLWTGGLLTLHAASDSLTALAYYSIPLTLFVFVRRRRDLEFHWMFLCFAVFILACGTTHLMEVWNIWHANYWVSGGFKALTAAASIPTAVLLIKLVPKALALPSPGQLRSLNTALRTEAKERQQAIEALQYSEERFRLLIESVRDYAIFMLDPTGRVSTWTVGAEHMKGWTASEIIGRHFSVFFPREDIASGKPESELASASASGRYEEEGWRLRRDGSRFWASVVISSIRNEAGQLKGFTKVTRDITERRKAANELQSRTEELARSEALRQGEERLQAVIDNLAEGLIISDLDGSLLYWNPAAVAMHGLTGHTDFKDRLANFADIYAIYDMDGSQLPFDKWPIPRIFRGEPLRDVQLRLKRLDSEWERSFSFSGALIRENSGRQLAFLSIIDVTERSRAEAQIRQLNASLEERVARRTAELEATNRELEFFSYSISHDLRAPLRAIDGYSMIMLEDYSDRFDDEGRRVLGVVRSESQRMGRLLDEVLEFSRLGTQKLNYTNVHMPALVRLAFKEVEHVCAHTKEIALHIGELPDAPGDATLLRQVWTNLLSNAVKFTRHCSAPSIEITAAPSEGHSCVYSVRDNGAGFDMRYSNKLFRVFQRLHRDEEFEGTGAGLAIVARIVQRHGGRVWAEGEPGSGATFHFTLPHAERTDP